MLDWHALLGIASTTILTVGVLPYAYSIVKGTTRPSGFSLIGWSLASAVPTAAQFVAGADWSIVIPLTATFNALIIFAVAQKGGKLSPSHSTDKYAFLLGVLAIVAWAISKDPLIAIYISIIADIMFSFPTISKTYRNPSSETLYPWLLYTLACLLGILSVTSFEVQNFAYAIYAFLMGSLIALLASRKYWGRGKINT